MDVSYEFTESPLRGISLNNWPGSLHSNFLRPAELSEYLNYKLSLYTCLVLNLRRIKVKKPLKTHNLEVS